MCPKIHIFAFTGRVGLLSFHGSLEPMRSGVKNEKMSDRCGLQGQPSLGLCGTADNPHHHSPVRVIGVSECLCIDLLFSDLSLHHIQVWEANIVFLSGCCLKAPISHPLNHSTDHFLSFCQHEMI